MKNLKTSLALLSILALAVAAAASGALRPSSARHDGMQMTQMSHMQSTATAAQLRMTLDNLLGEHALLAIWATQAGYSGEKSFPALAAQLDQNSVAISKAIASVYGKAAGNQFLNGKNLWRAHTAHVLQLKGQLDAYAKGNYKQAYALADGAYNHMFMTGDLLAGAIAKQKGLK